MKKFTYESAKENFDEMMLHAQEGLHVYVTGSDGREYQLMLKYRPPRKPGRPGSSKCKIRIADDFDAPLPEMAPYM